MRRRYIPLRCKSLAWLQNIFTLIQEKINLGYPEDDCYVDCYAYSMNIDRLVPLSVTSSSERKVLPFKGKVFIDSFSELYIREERNGKLLKKKIKIYMSNKHSLYMFSSSESCLESYRVESKKALDIIDNHINQLLELKNFIFYGEKNL